MRSSPESAERAGYDGTKRKKGSKLRTAVGTLGYLLAFHVAPADDLAPVGQVAKAVRAATGESVQIAFVNQKFGVALWLQLHQHGLTNAR